MRIERLMLAAAVATAFTAGASVSQAQTTAAGTTPTTTASSTGSATTFTSTGTATTPTGTSASSGATTGTTATTGTAAVQTAATASGSMPTSSETQYLRHVPTRFVTLAGSSTNLQNLVHGLRTGTTVTLTSTSTTTSGTPVTQSVTFTPQTRPMGYGNITRALTLASRELAAAGISNPTPQQLQTALTGGTLTTAQGTTTMPGILQLRSDGMGWGKIARTIGVHPGSDKSAEMLTQHSQRPAGITTAAGTSRAGARDSASQRDTEQRSSANAQRGIVTASGAAASTVQRMHPVETRGSGMVTAAGSATGSGIVSAAGSSGAGHAHGHEGRR